MNDGRDLRNLDRRDDDLRDRFAGLRQEETQRVPEFASLWRGRARTPFGKGRWLVAAACALIVAVAAVFGLRSAHHKPENVSASITAWISPTDFLLETPGRELLRTVPEIGVWHGYMPPGALEARPSRIKRKFL